MRGATRVHGHSTTTQTTTIVGIISAMKPSQRSGPLMPGRLLLLLVAELLLRPRPVLGFPASPSPSSSSAFSTFQFAPNGVCVSPGLFVDSDNGGGRSRRFTMKNVPGEGDCMFLAVALATFASTGLGANDALLRVIAKEIRRVVATILETPGNLVIEGRGRLVSTDSLLKSAAAQEGLSPTKYLRLLRKEGAEGGLYAGGPELTVLANVLRRPISIYELVSDDDAESTPRESNGVQLIDCKGVFGQEAFRDPLTAIPDSAVLSTDLSGVGAYSWHLHILVVDASPDEKHACVLLPQE